MRALLWPLSLVVLSLACGGSSEEAPGARGGTPGTSGEAGAPVGGQAGSASTGGSGGSSAGGASGGGAGSSSSGSSGQGGSAGASGSAGQGGAAAGAGGSPAGGQAGQGEGGGASAGASGAGGDAGGAAGGGGAGKPVCEQPYDQRNLSAVNGLNSKWRTYSKRLLNNTGYLSSETPGDADTRVTIQPDLGGLSPVAWLQRVSALGTASRQVNRLMLNLDPGSLYAKASDASVISAQDWADYKVATLKDRLELTAAEVKLIEKLQKSIDQNRFTVNQRNGLLLAFLAALESGPGGACSASPAVTRRVPFFLHQRKYVHEKPGVNHDDEDQFADEMSDFINLVRARDASEGTHLQRWIAGVRLGENMSPDPQQWKASVLYIVKRINDSTDGFLKKREVIANGPQMGSDYKIKSGGQTVSIDDDLGGDTFLASMSKETDSFGIGYKFMVHDGTIGSQLMATTCPDGNACDPDSEDDWTFFLKKKGFDELASFANHFHASYPRHANVVWVGDSGDAMATLTKGAKEPKPVPSYRAIAALFQGAPQPASRPNFQGVLFMIANTSEMDFEDPTGPHDIGKYMLYLNGSGTWPTQNHLPLDWLPAADHSSELLSATVQMWSSWPALP